MREPSEETVRMIEARVVDILQEGGAMPAWRIYKQLGLKPGDDSGARAVLGLAERGVVRRTPGQGWHLA